MVTSEIHFKKGGELEGEGDEGGILTVKQDVLILWMSFALSDQDFNISFISSFKLSSFHEDQKG